MRASRHQFNGYGPPEEIERIEADAPEPGPGEVVVRVRATSTNMGDWILLTGKPYIVRMMFGLRAPKKRVPGGDVAGEGAAVGEGVSTFKIGDRVFGELSAGGAYSTHVRARADELVGIPAHVGFEQAGVTPVAGAAALQAFRIGGMPGPGTTVQVNGASSGVGYFVTQIARAHGCEVHGVCSGRNADFVRTQGATRVYDYTAEDFTASEVRYDRVIDIVGNRKIRDCRRVMKDGAHFVGVTGGLDNPWIGPFLYMAKLGIANRRGSQRFKMLIATPSTDDLNTLGAMIARGEITPPVERRFAYEEVPEALAHQGTGRSRGKTLITID